MHEYDIERGKLAARALLADCGLTREDLLKIPRKMPLTPLELSRIETEKKSTRPKPGHWPDVPVASNGSVRGEIPVSVLTQTRGKG